MVSAKFYAALRPQQTFLGHVTSDIFNHMDAWYFEDKLETATPIFNYANFFEKGLDLYDNSLEFGGSDDYYGFVGEPIILAICLTNSTLADLTNGITIYFDKFACSSIEIYGATWDGEDSESVLCGNLIYLAQTESCFDLKTHIPLEIPAENETNNAFYIRLSNINSEKSYITLKGFTMGKALDITDFFSFDSIAEIRPLGEDLPLNEITSKIYLPEKFVSSENQAIVYFDNTVMENGLLASIKKERKDIFTLKSRNMINLINESEDRYCDTRFVDADYGDWNNVTITAAAALEKFSAQDEMSFSYPEWFSTYKLSQFLPPCSGRKILQQIAWATCCGIDTNYKDEITFVPLLADDFIEETLTISNDDDRIMESNVIEGDKYSKIIWEYTKYGKKTQIEELGEIEVEPVDLDGETWYVGVLTLSEPFVVNSFGKNFDEEFGFESGNPFSQEFIFDNDKSHIANGYKYHSKKVKNVIYTGLKKGKTLTISDQTIYPIDTSKKMAQIAKWYAHNNTLNATVVDNGDIRLGKIISLQLEDGTYFTGVITKIERSNISDYHTVRLEAHEWH